MSCKVILTLNSGIASILINQSSFFPPDLKPEERADKLLAEIKVCIHSAEKVDDFGVVGNEACN